MKLKQTELRLFLVQATLAVSVVLLLVVLSLRITGNLPRMSASGIYSPAPTYGVLRLPSGQEFTRDSKVNTTFKSKKNPLLWKPRNTKKK